MAPSDGTVAEEHDSIMSHCKTAPVSLDFSPIRGRLLRAERCIESHEHILTAPCEHYVDIPYFWSDTEACRVDDQNSALGRLYGQVNKVREVSNSHYSTDLYWAALLSLTPEEGPEDEVWPSISAETQARLLQLFRPESLSPVCHGRRALSAGNTSPSAPSLARNVVGAAHELAGLAIGARLATDQLPQRTGRIEPSEDIACWELCRHFALRVEPSKLEDLLLVWKFNSFASAYLASEDNGAESDEKCCTRFKIYLAPSMITHSCEPNCIWEQADDTDCFRLFCGADGLAAGEELTISYLSPRSLQECDAGQRQNILAKNWFFFCACGRCAARGCPTCPQCPGIQMEVVVSQAEEQVYPGYDVFCDGCPVQDLQTQFGYLFHCDQCKTDLCPNCAFPGEGLWIPPESEL